MINKIEEGALTLVDGTGKINEGTKLIYDNLQTVLSSLENLNIGAGKIDEGLKEILKNLQGTKNLLTGLNTNELNMLITANEQTINNLDPIKDANIINLLTKNNETITKISTLATTIEPVINNLEKYLTELENGSKQISNGTKQLSDGVKILTEKTGELKLGIDSLYKGSNELYTGIKTFNTEGITKINNLVNSKVKTTEKRLKALIDLSESYETFTMKNENTKGNTKFILNIEGVKEVEEKEIEEEKEEKITLWTRIKNLFK